VFTFRDTDVFTDEDVSIQRIALYGNNENLEKTMHQMASLFSAVGGPLAILFSDSLDYMAPVATGVRIESERVFGMVDGKAARAGSLEYMSRCGVKIPTDTSKDAISLSTKVMYVAEGDEVYARVYIRYAFSEEFTMLLPVLEDDEIIPLIYTRDPNLSNEFLRSFTAGSDTVRVLKKTTLPEDENAVYGSLSVGIATLGEKSNLINMLLLSKKYVRFQHRMALFELMAASVGVLLGAVLSLTGLIAVPSAVLSLWQLAWCIALSFMSRRTLVTTRNNKEAENEEKENKDK